MFCQKMNLLKLSKMYKQTLDLIGLVFFIFAYKQYHNEALEEEKRDIFKDTY